MSKFLNLIVEFQVLHYAKIGLWHLFNVATL